MASLARFIIAGANYVPLDRVHSAVRTPSGKFKLIDADGKLLDECNGEHFFTNVVEIMMDAGPWELLSMNHEEEQWSYQAEPILGWAVTLAGRIVAVTAADVLDGDLDWPAPIPASASAYRAIRRVGDQRVYAISGAYENAEAWLAEHKAARDRADAGEED